MRVRFLTSIAINHDGPVAVYAFGESCELPDHEAEAHINAGHAEPYVEAPAVETAVASRPEEEQAVRERGRRGAKQ